MVLDRPWRRPGAATYALRRLAGVVASGYGVSFQYRALRQTDRVRFSTLTGWEAPDPAWEVPIP